MAEKKEKRKLTVAITGLNNHDNPGPGIPVIRSLRDSDEFDFRIIGFAYENMEPGIYMHELVDKTYLIPYPVDGVETLWQRLNYIHSVEKLDVIIPNYDAEFNGFSKLENRLRDLGIKMFLPTVEQFEERQKHNLPEYGKKYDLKIPFSIPINKAEDIYNLPEKFTYPIVVKGKFYDAHIAYSPEQAVTYFNKLASKWGIPIIIQEFIKGTEVNVAALGDGKGNAVGAVPMKKQYITDKGKGWAGITLEEPKMLELTSKIMKATKWRGGMEIELIKAENDDLYIVEINPRIPAWIYLAVGAGQNIPEALIKLILGEEVETLPKHKQGVMFVRYSYDRITSIEEFQKIATLGEL